jgi:hypothetical protein
MLALERIDSVERQRAGITFGLEGFSVSAEVMVSRAPCASDPYDESVDPTGGPRCRPGLAFTAETAAHT